MTALPFDLKLTNIAQGQELIQQQWPTKTISLVNQGQTVSQSSSIDSIVFTVDNVTVPRSQSGILSPKNTIDLCDFSQKISQSDRVLICSPDGISRNTAVAIGILCQHGLDPSVAFEVVEHLVPQFDPNQLILYQLDINLGLKLSLVDEYNNWKARKKHWVNSMPLILAKELIENAREYFAHYG